MEFINATRLAAGYSLGTGPDAREFLIVVVKASFGIPQAGEEPKLLKSQVPLQKAEAFTGEPGLSSILYECDFAPLKPRCDVLLNGTAYAPGGTSVTELPVMLQVGSVSKSLRVVGNRGWVKDVFSWKATRPLPFAQMPVSYDRAFGGRDLDHPDETKHRWYALNHAGVGYHSNLDLALVEGKRLPNTEEVGKPVDRPDGKFTPMAYGVIGRSWEPRAKLAGTYDKNWKENVFPFLPSDFKEEFYQSAPRDQQMSHPRGGESVELVGLSPGGRESFKLPSLAVPIQFTTREGEKHATATVDTILLEPDLGRFLMTGKAILPLRRNLIEVKRVVVGKMSPGWYRARETGKSHCRSLAEVRSHRGVKELETEE